MVYYMLSSGMSKRHVEKSKRHVFLFYSFNALFLFFVFIFVRVKEGGLFLHLSILELALSSGLLYLGLGIQQKVDCIHKCLVSPI